MFKYHLKQLLAQMECKEYDLILTFARGGLSLAAFIAYAKDIKTVHTYNSVRAIGPSISIQPNQRILLIDDINDSGATLTKALELLRELKYGGVIDTAVMYQRYNSTFSCTYVAEVINHDAYIYFPWDKEVWKDCVNHPNYEVSSQGNTRSKSRGTNHDHYVDVYGYEQVPLYKDKTPYTKLVHREVAKAFIPNPKNLEIVNHLDGNKRNNFTSNLEWCTKERNSSHALEEGLIPRKWTEDIIKDIQSLREKEVPWKDIADHLGSTVVQAKSSYAYHNKRK